jgi:hypothetical protein
VKDMILRAEVVPKAVWKESFVGLGFASWKARGRGCSSETWEGLALEARLMLDRGTTLRGCSPSACAMPFGVDASWPPVDWLG